MRWILGVAVAIGLLVGCSSGNGDSAPPQMGVSEVASDAASSPLPQVIVTGSIGLRVGEQSAAAEMIRSLTAATGGAVDSETISTGEDAQFMFLTVRIPADQFDTYLSDVAQLGDVTDQSITRTDVTTQVLDLDAQIAALEPSVARITQLLAEATTVADVIAAESALVERQARLDGLIAQREYLAKQIDMATVFITLTNTGGSSTNIALFFGGALVGAILIALGAAALWIARRR